MIKVENLSFRYTKTPQSDYVKRSGNRNLYMG